MTKGIDPNRIGIAGDSAGASLSVASILMARDRGLPLRFCFQMLFYPWLDGRNESESFKRYTDTPMWNAALSKEVTPLINPEPEKTPLAYRSPEEAESLSGMLQREWRFCGTCFGGGMQNEANDHFHHYCHCDGAYGNTVCQSLF